MNSLQILFKSGLLFSIYLAFNVFMMSCTLCVVLCIHACRTHFDLQRPFADNMQIQLILYFTGGRRLPCSADHSGKLPSGGIQVCESNAFIGKSSNSLRCFLVDFSLLFSFLSFQTPSLPTPPHTPRRNKRRKKKKKANRQARTNCKRENFFYIVSRVWN